jgi:hypothetical protein
LRNILDPFGLPVTRTMLSVTPPLCHVNRATPVHVPLGTP